MNIRNKLLHTHGAILTLVGLALAIYSLIATQTGFGLYGFLQTNPMVEVGLLQAYLLMALIGVVLRRNAAQIPTTPWHWVAATAHLAPLLTVLLFWNLLGTMGFTSVAIGSAVFHTLGILFEAGAALTALQNGKATQPR